MDRLIEFVGNHWELSSLFVVLLITLFFMEKKRSGTTLSPQQTTLMLNKDEAIVVDVRDHKEYAEGHITGALNIPYGKLQERSVELEKYKDKMLIVADKMGQHSGTAVKTLTACGFDKVCRLNGGVTEWRNANMPLVKKQQSKKQSGKK